MQYKEKAWFKILMMVVLPAMLLVVYYFIFFKDYEHKSVVSMKIVEEQKFMLRQYKRASLELTEDEYNSLRVTYPEQTFIQEAAYYFIVDTKQLEVSKAVYDAYEEGDSIKYYNKLIVDFPRLTK